MFQVLQVMKRGKTQVSMHTMCPLPTPRSLSYYLPSPFSPVKHLYFLLTRKLNQILKKLQSQESLHFQFRRCKGLTPREVFSRYLPFFPNMERSMKIFISAEVLFGGICCKIVDGFTPHK